MASKPTVAYASYCCSKDRERFVKTQGSHILSHNYPFDELFQVFQRCDFPEGQHSFDIPEGYFDKIKGVHTRIKIKEEDYPKILGHFGIKYPDEVADKWTHGWTASHFWAHHCVNLLRAAMSAESDYIVFADGDCNMRDQLEGGPSWVEVGIGTLENNPEMFVVSPSDGRPHGGPDRIMSQQLFIVNRKRFLEMEFIPWDGNFMEGGPMAEYYFMMEGRIDRHMRKHNLFRYVLPLTYRYWHGAWH